MPGTLPKKRSWPVVPVRSFPPRGWFYLLPGLSAVPCIPETLGWLHLPLPTLGWRVPCTSLPIAHTEMYALPPALTKGLHSHKRQLARPQARCDAHTKPSPKHHSNRTDSCFHAQRSQAWHNGQAQPTAPSSASPGPAGGLPWPRSPLPVRKHTRGTAVPHRSHPGTSASSAGSNRCVSTLPG